MIKQIIVILLLLIFSTANAKKYNSKPASNVINSKIFNQFFIDAMIGYSFNKQKLNNSYDLDSFDLSNNDQITYKSQDSAIIAAGIGYKITDQTSLVFETNHLTKFSGTYKRTLPQDSLYDNYAVISTQSATRFALGLQHDLFKFNDKFIFMIEGGGGLSLNQLDSADIFGVFYDRNAASDDRLYKAYGSTKCNFAWHLGAGVRYTFSNKIEFLLSYKYIDYGKFKSNENAYNYFVRTTDGRHGRLYNNPGQNLKFHLRTQSIMAGLRINL